MILFIDTTLGFGFVVYFQLTSNRCRTAKAPELGNKVAGLTLTPHFLQISGPDPQVEAEKALHLLRDRCSFDRRNCRALEGIGNRKCKVVQVPA